LTGRGETCAGAEILRISGADEVEALSRPDDDDDDVPADAILAVNMSVSCSTLVGDGLRGPRTRSSGATERLSKLGDPGTGSRCAIPLNGDKVF
jgi:hypothetical protein